MHRNHVCSDVLLAANRKLWHIVSSPGWVPYNEENQIQRSTQEATQHNHPHFIILGVHAGSRFGVDKQCYSIQNWAWHEQLQQQGAQTLQT